ncbi:transmembrane protein 223 [Halyomorpha halys]|uniref:transmembrane protein 223 n=1 Tax=Halyomorpha halys TaxID=286706 RepID=UPI0006D50F2D|nr:transmembrane protein 223 [Halyomorpha halys]
MILLRPGIFKNLFKASRIVNTKILGNVFFKNYAPHSQELLKLNTNVVKDVILFKYDNPKYFKYITYFGVSQFIFWMYLSHFAFTTLRDAPVPKEGRENLPWWRRINLGEQKYRNGITLFCGVVGYLFLLASWSYTIRSVRYLILRKGGKSVSFVTYGPFGKNSIMDVPIAKMSASESRENARVQLPIKVKGKFFYYMLDMRGEFPNKLLFDATAGLRRKLP